MKNLQILLEDQPGVLAKVGETLGRAGISLEGGGMFVVNGKGYANFLVNDATAARRALESAGIQLIQVEDVVLQKLNQDEPGQLGKLLRQMAEAGVNVLTQYSDHSHQLVLVVDDLRSAQAVSEAWTDGRSAQQNGDAAMNHQPTATTTAFSPKKRSHHYALQVTWTGNIGSGTSSYTAYGRGHEISAPGKVVIGGSSDAAFRGDKTRYNPEELLVASASACHMLSYLHLCAVNGIVVLTYDDRPTGEMEEVIGGPGAFIRLDLHPTVTITASSDAKRAVHLHEEAHHGCFIANSLKVPVLVHPSVRKSDSDEEHTSPRLGP